MQHVRLSTVHLPRTSAVARVVCACALFLASGGAHAKGCDASKEPEPFTNLGPFFIETDTHAPGETDENAESDGEESHVGEEMPGSFALLRRRPDGVEYVVHATELSVGHVYTLQAMIFNDPSSCTGNVEHPTFSCSIDDLFAGRGAFSAITLDGALLEEGTELDFAGSIMVGDSTGVWDGDGLLAPDVEISFDIFDMGPPIDGLLDEQLSTHDAGCREGEPNQNGDVGFCIDLAGNAI